MTSRALNRENLVPRNEKQETRRGLILDYTRLYACLIYVKTQVWISSVVLPSCEMACLILSHDRNKPAVLYPTGDAAAHQSLTAYLFIRQPSYLPI